MDLFEAFKKRHSYRGDFTDEKVSRYMLEKIVEAGILAPSGKNEQTTQFVVVDDEEKVKEIASISGGRKAFHTASAYIVCLIDREPEPILKDMNFQVEDCAAAVENMLLAVSSFGLATVWIDGWLRVEGRNEKVCEILGVPKNKIARVILPIGYPAKTPEGPEKLGINERASFNTYDLS
ncbi:FMN reductase [NAD(P)H] [Sedimentisphaera cyanobacteriorum]|uniref:FMN reductase [NAD(P)H] n=1 Tax=Sedimentisphaera cyanobacteriorum TaxID=1940790 RepID=A0A1Q2HM87_9BACT|nr:nitroreductase family protein [Sedimentisphaera cyanobacteriorum]AQQ08480.1 FMN reductase [NAD(P)H] [Sedimentisphaera cyanobacteriorum]